MSKSKSAYSTPGKIGKVERHIIVVWVDNEAGVLARIAGLFSGRGYNIESLAVAEVDKKKHQFIVDELRVAAILAFQYPSGAAGEPRSMS